MPMNRNEFRSNYEHRLLIRAMLSTHSFDLCL